MLEFRTGRGLRFTVLVERAMDIAECEYKGQAIGWHSPAGFRHPALAARERGEMIWLEHGMSRDYHVVLRILDGAQQIAEAESEIRNVTVQPQEDYPRPTGDFLPLGGRP
jgi:hypothetical protein